jgi:hypothetical protein
MKIKLTLAAFLALAMSTSAQLVNGDFDTSGGWTVSNGAFILGGYGGIAPETGSNFGVVDGSSALAPNATLTQTIPIASNTDYTLEGYAQIFSSPGNSLFESTAIVDLGAFGNANFQLTAVGLWIPFSSTFNSGSATSFTLTLGESYTTQFANDNIAIAFDSISLTAAPVPEASSALLGGLGALALLGRRRR